MSTVALARVVRDALQQQQQTIESGLLAGVKDKDEYWMLVGRRQGLLQALSTLDDELRRFDEQE